MRVTDQSTYRLMQSNLDRVTNTLQDLRYQGATGIKLNKPSDDPSAIRPVLSTRSEIREVDRYIETMQQTADKMAATDGYTAQVENLLVRAKEIGIASLNSSLSQSDLDSYASEVDQLKSELLGVGNAVVDGKFIFAGYNNASVPFVENPDYDPASYDITDVTTWPVLYNGDFHPTQLEVSNGEYVEANITGNELFLGITNDIAANGYSNPFQGQSVTSGNIAPGPFADDIVITVESDPVVTTTIPGSSLVDGPAETNYVGNVVAPLFNQTVPGTGLVATVNPATKNLGPLSLTGFDETELDAYRLEITAGSSGTTVSVSIDGPATNFDYTLEGMASALANSSPAPSSLSLTPTSGVLANGVAYDISSGSLVLTGPDDGSEIEINETIIDNGVTATSGGIAGGSQTIYGTINLATNSDTDVTLGETGSGLANVGLSATTLDGAEGNIDLFTVLTQLEEALRAGNLNDVNEAGGGIELQISNLEIGADQNRQYRSDLGLRAERIETAIASQEDAKFDLQQILSRYQDADIIEVYNDILQKESAFEAALNITGRISQISILEYF